MNPYKSPNAISSEGTASNAWRFRSSIGSALAYSVWGTGAFLLSLLVLVDFLMGTKLPGGLIYVSFALGPIVGVCGAIATKRGTRGKIYLIIATLCIQPIQFVIIGLAILSTSGFEGIQ